MKKIILLIFRLLKEFRLPLAFATTIVILNILDYLLRGTSPYSVFVSCLFTYIAAIVLYLIHPIFVKIMGSVILILTAVFYYLFYIASFSILPTNLWIFLIQTNVTEASHFITWKFILFMLSILILIYFLWKIKPSFPYLLHKKTSVKRMLCYTVILVLSIKPTMHLYFEIFHIKDDVSRASISYASTFHLRHRIISSIKDFGKKTSYFNELKIQKKPLNIYLIIGESLRGDHLSINGYSRKTNPLLEKEEIINFGINRSCGNMTYISWQYLFSAHNSCNENISNNPQIPFSDYFTKVGYKTLLLSQDNESSMITVVKTVDQAKGAMEYQNNLYAAVQSMDVLSQNKLFILNTYGSHAPYIEPSINQLNLFKPFLYNPDETYAVLTKANQSNITNSYDNTIIFLDWQIKHLIQDLKKSKEPSILLYTSDHGEMMNENNQGYGHGGNSIENYIVPFFLWVNNKFKEEYPNEYKNLINNQKHYQNRLTHITVFHSLMDIAGFTNKTEKKVINKDLSLFSKSFKAPLEKPIEYNQPK